MMRHITSLFSVTCVFLAACAMAQAMESPAEDLAGQLIAHSGIQGGLCVQIGGDAELTASLAKAGGLLTHMIHADAERVRTAQDYLHQKGLYGLAWAEYREDITVLPYTENLVNLVVIADSSGGVFSPAEVLRVLRPEGVVCLNPGLAQALREEWRGTPQEDLIELVDLGAMWGLFRKPWPVGMDEWGHPRHGPDSHPVSNDIFVGPPRRVRWVTGPIKSPNEMVTAKGRNFYGAAIARDSFNGLPLWRKTLGGNGASHWNDRGEIQPVAVGDRLYVTHKGELQARDAATGEIVQTYPAAGSPAELYVTEEALVLADMTSVRVLDLKTGDMLWKRAAYDPTCIAAGDGAVFFTEGNRRRGENRQGFRVNLLTGQDEWSIIHARHESQDRSFDWLPDAAWCSYADGLLLYEVSSFNDLVEGNGLYVVDAKTGAFLWGRAFARHGHSKQARAFYIGSLVYVLDESRCTGLDPGTGEVRMEVPTFAGHCFPSVCTTRYFISGEMSFVDLQTLQVDSNRITKGSCGRNKGVTPANGLVYASPKGCVCWPFLNGFCAMAPAKINTAQGTVPAEFALDSRRDCPSASGAPASDYEPDEWPTYRHDGWRSGSTVSTVPTALEVQWSVDLGAWPDTVYLEDWKSNMFVQGPVSSPTVACNTVYVARPDAHEIVALDAETGEARWRFTANGRVDGPPTLYEGLCLFGARNGWVYCLDALSGELVWRLRAAPDEERIVSFSQVESPWPVPGSVLVVDCTAYFGAGRQYLADGGIRVFAVDARTGKVKWTQRINDFPGKHYYRSNSIEHDSFDLMHRENGKISLSRWQFEIETGAMTLDPESGFAHLTTGGPGVMAPRGLWTYGPRMGRGQDTKATRRPLAAFRDGTLYGGDEAKEVVYRRDFTSESIKAFDAKWFDNRAVEAARQKGEGETSRSYRLMQGAAWETSLGVHGAITAMVLTADALFVACDGGELLALSSNGEILSERNLPQTAWDGMAAAYNNLYVSTMDGTLVCLAGKREQDANP